jgi:hypothetical protein
MNETDIHCICNKQVDIYTTVLDFIGMYFIHPPNICYFDFFISTLIIRLIQKIKVI